MEEFVFTGTTKLIRPVRLDIDRIGGSPPPLSTSERVTERSSDGPRTSPVRYHPRERVPGSSSTDV